jgi:hypothetical protein
MMPIAKRIISGLLFLLIMHNYADAQDYSKLIKGNWLEVKRTDFKGIQYNDKGQHLPGGWILSFDDQGYFHFNTPHHRDSGRWFPYKVVDTILQSERNYSIHKLDSTWMILSAVFNANENTGYIFYFVRDTKLNSLPSGTLSHLQQDSKADTAFLMRAIEKQVRGSEYYFLYAQQLSQFPGGKERKDAYVRKHFYKDGVKSKKARYFSVDLTFEKDGSISEAFTEETEPGITRVPRGFEAPDEKRISAIFKSMPVWNPATQYGVPVRLRMNIDIVLKP